MRSFTSSLCTGKKASEGKRQYNELNDICGAALQRCPLLWAGGGPQDVRIINIINIFCLFLRSVCVQTDGGWGYGGCDGAGSG